MTGDAIEFEITAHPRNAAVARHKIRHIARNFGFTGQALADIEIAAGEAVTNAILYGSPSAGSRITICCSFVRRDNTLVVEVQDEGMGFDASRVCHRGDHEALGGRGIPLMRALMDSVLMTHNGAGMLVRMRKSAATS